MKPCEGKTISMEKQRSCNKVRMVFMCMVAMSFSVVISTAFPTSVIAKESFRLGHIMPPDTPEGIALEHFAQVVSEKSKGDLEVKVYHSGQLGKTLDIVESTMHGSIDISLEDALTYDKFIPLVRILGMPYYFKDRDQLHKLLNSKLWKDEFESKLEKMGSKVLNTKWNWDRGPYRVLVSKKPIFNLEDLKGVKLRIWEVETLRRGWSALGAVPIVISWSEAYLALKQGIADAITCPIGLLYSARFTEVLKYVTVTKQFPQTMCLAMNVKKFSKLQADQQKILIEAADEAGKVFSLQYVKEANEDIQLMMDEHGASFIQTSLIPWREKAQEARKEVENSGYLPKGFWEKMQKM